MGPLGNPHQFIDGNIIELNVFFDEFGGHAIALFFLFPFSVFLELR